jgi:hypothetical protein
MATEHGETACFVCLDADEQLLRDVCACKSLAVHAPCLQRWIGTSGASQCAICGDSYRDPTEIAAMCSAHVESADRAPRADDDDHLITLCEAPHDLRRYAILALIALLCIYAISPLCSMCVVAATLLMAYLNLWVVALAIMYRMSAASHHGLA